MSSRNRIARLATIFTIATAFAALPHTAAASKSCKSWAFVGQATAATQGQAAAKARTDWAQKVAGQFGFQWANWMLAEDRWEKCERWDRSVRCLAHGRPCMPGLELKRE